MTSLREIQRRVCDAICTGEAAHVMPLLDHGAIPAEIQVQIYQNNALETFRKALAADYPVIERLVGDVCFRGLCREYQRRHPSRCGNLQLFGASFVGLLTDLYARTEHDYLPDVARLERACGEVLLEPEFKLPELETLGGVSCADFSSRRLNLRRGIRLIGSDYPVLTIWRANQPGASGHVDLREGAQRIVVLRRGGDAVLMLVSPGALQLIKALQDRQTLPEACGSVLSAFGGDSLEEALGSLVALGA